MTYPTYQAAKIANPDQEIKTDNLGNFFVSVGHTTCNPADYCMTVKQFLDAGHKFVEEDFILGQHGLAYKVSSCLSYNQLLEGDDKRYVLKAKALEEAKREIEPAYRYEKVELSPKEIFMAMLNGEEFYVLGDLIKFDGEQFWLHTEEGKARITYINHDHEIQRRIEVTGRELFIEELNKLANKFAECKGLQIVDDPDMGFFGYLFDSGKFKLVNGKG